VRTEDVEPAEVVELTRGGAGDLQEKEAVRRSRIVKVEKSMLTARQGFECKPAKGRRTNRNERLPSSS